MVWSIHDPGIFSSSVLFFELIVENVSYITFVGSVKIIRLELTALHQAEDKGITWKQFFLIIE